MHLARTKIWLPMLLIMVVLLVLSLAAVDAQSDPVRWDAWESLDISTIGDDNSGSTLDREGGVNGAPALRVTPGGMSEETKLAIPLTGTQLADFLTYGQVELDVFLPDLNALNPNRFFMGMADVTGGGFAWMGGIFSATEAQPGWNRVVYGLDRAMRTVLADHDYSLFFSFFNEGDTGVKTPLTEPFFIGHGYLSGADPMSAAGEALNPTSDEPYREEVDNLLGMDDAAFVNAVARETFDFFWLEANPDNGLVRDRSTADSPASIAAVGFGMAALPLAVDRGWISYDEGYERALTTLQTFVSGGVQGEHGFFYHFVTMQTGERMWNSEVSSIDTALLVAGALAAGQYFAQTDVQTLADQLYANVEWDWMLGGGTLLKMGWNPEGGFINASWDHFDESMILYALAIGSPTHPIPADTWTLWHRPISIRGGYIYLPGEPLFVYQYPLAYLNLQDMEDHFANYWNNTTLACERNRQFAIDNRDHFLTYGDGVWGLSASDGASGYRAYGASEVNHDGTVAPYAAAACLPFTPENALEGMRAILTEYGTLAWGEYGFVSAINEDENWYSRDHIGIDQGDILLMIANYQDSFVWDLFMANPNMQNALDAMGFVESSGDYAITPGYLAEVTGR